MRRLHRSRSFRARAVLVSAWGGVCALILAAPLLALHSRPRAAAIVYTLFSPICHQRPERSFLLSGFPLAVCHRCCGMYLGLFLGSMLGGLAPDSPRARRACMLAAVLPIALDLLASLAGLWTSTCVSRFSTGLLFGALVSPLLAHGFAEFIAEAPWRRLTLQPRTQRRPL